MFFVEQRHCPLSVYMAQCPLLRTKREIYIYHFSRIYHLKNIFKSHGRAPSVFKLKVCDRYRICVQNCGHNHDNGVCDSFLEKICRLWLSVLHVLVCRGYLTKFNTMQVRYFKRHTYDWSRFVNILNIHEYSAWFILHRI